MDNKRTLITIVSCTTATALIAWYYLYRNNGPKDAAQRSNKHVDDNLPTIGYYILMIH